MSLFEQLQEEIEIEKREQIEREKHIEESKKQLLEMIGDKKNFIFLKCIVMLMIYLKGIFH